MAAPLRPAAFLIAGPTASGKSAVALRLAERLGGLVINADSMQLYRDLRVLTARPTPEDEARAPHRLFGVVDAAQNHSVGLWLADAGAALREARATGQTPIFVGGTGLYFKALTQGLSAIPAVAAAVRATLRAETATLAPAALHARLAACDPVMAARLRPTDPQRVLRALEVFVATGKSLASFQGARQPPLLDGATCRSIFLAPDRAALKARIEARFDAMLAAGALDEVAALAARNLDPALPAMRAHGVPHLIAALRGEMTLAAAADLGKRDTRRYAKRQFTFARHQLPDFVWRAPEAAAELAEGER
jgi:tRNA dimethylallyltransferase